MVPWAFISLLPHIMPPPQLASLQVELLMLASADTFDTDRDGIPDKQEVEQMGTDPYRRDSDGDGIIDSREDLDRDGVVDPGESDPNVHGLFPGAFPHIAEPMVFDLVRGLGASKGELETNVLMVSVLRPYGGVAWAPEVEWAFSRGHAIELELPMQDHAVAALKTAVQGTLPERFRNLIHGWQVIGEYLLKQEAFEATGLYLNGLRFNSVFSLMTMAGLRRGWWPEGLRHLQGLLNLNAFFDLAETVTLGLETLLEVDAHRLGWALIPQAHWQFARHFRVQAGGGASNADGRVAPLIALRFVVE